MEKSEYDQMMEAEIYSNDVRDSVVTNAKIAATIKRKNEFLGYIHYKGIYDIKIEQDLRVHGRLTYYVWLENDKAPISGSGRTYTSNKTQEAREGILSIIKEHDRLERIRMLND
jgi:hypothetical protein